MAVDIRTYTNEELVLYYGNHKYSEALIPEGDDVPTKYSNMMKTELLRRLSRADRLEAGIKDIMQGQETPKWLQMEILVLLTAKP